MANGWGNLSSNDVIKCTSIQSKGYLGISAIFNYYYKHDTTLDIYVLYIVKEEV